MALPSGPRRVFPLLIPGIALNWLSNWQSLKQFLDWSESSDGQDQTCGPSDFQCNWAGESDTQVFRVLPGDGKSCPIHSAHRIDTAPRAAW